MSPRLLVAASLLLLSSACSKDAKESSNDESRASGEPATAERSGPAGAPTASPVEAQPLPKAATVDLTMGSTETFEYGCPTGWELKEPAGKQKSLNCSGEGAMCFALEEHGAGNLTPAQYWKKALDAQAKMMGPLAVDEEGAFESKGVPFYRAITKEGIFYAYTDKGRAVTLSCIAMGGDLGAVLPTLDAISQSFRWK